MKLHANAALSLNHRRRLAERVCEQGWRLGDAAVAAETSARTAQKWSARFRAEGEQGLRDRSSAAKRVWNRTPADRVATIVALRKLRFSGPEIAELLEMAPSTVSAVCRREGVGRLGRLGLEPARRYERSRPGELIHIDVKKLGRIARPGHRVTGRRAQW
ncbi:MAG TPA: leucine zipper domain-containing protein, partial [Solirubrobacterales bacterium]|nr:leucine zipper domain-containing protein [Solirubrobacterales bacterium]